MSQVTVYSSAPASPQLASAFQSLRNRGIEVVLKPVSALVCRPHAVAQPAASELLDVSLRLAAIGEQLTHHEQGTHRLDAGTENGLRAERDSLQTRQKALQATIQAQKGGQGNG
ncbi:MAG: hypothetical protein ACRYFX_05700 [Janthinobacterium lividum]